MNYSRTFFLVLFILIISVFFIKQQNVFAQSCAKEGTLCFSNSECCSGRCETYTGAMFGNKRCAAASPTQSPSSGAAACPNPCLSSQSGTMRCDPTDSKKIQLCGYDSGKQCYGWAYFQTCSSNQICSNGQCISLSSAPPQCTSYVAKPYCQGGKEPIPNKDSKGCIISYTCPEQQVSYGQARPSISISASKTSVKINESFNINLSATTTDSQGIDYINICETMTSCFKTNCYGSKTCNSSKSFSKSSKGTYTFSGYAQGKNGLDGSNNGSSVSVIVTDSSSTPPPSSSDPIVRADKNKDGKIDEQEYNQAFNDWSKSQLYTEQELLTIYNKWIKDKQGASNDTRTLSVSISNPPEAKTKESVKFEASVSNIPSGDKVSTYYWKFNDGYQSSTSYNSINRTFLSPGKYTLNLEVKTQKGLKGQASTTITIIDSSSTPPPSSSDDRKSGATSCLADNLLCFSNSECCSGVCETYTGAMFGNKRCKSVSSSSVTDTRTLSVSISNPPEAKTKESVKFEASVSNIPSGDKVSTYYWKFNDGYQSSTSYNSINRTFLSPGKYTLNLEVKTQKGLKGQASTTITIIDSSSTPPPSSSDDRKSGATSCLADNLLCFSNSECCSGVCETYTGAMFGNKRCKSVSSSSVTDTRTLSVSISNPPEAKTKESVKFEASVSNIPSGDKVSTYYWKFNDGYQSSTSYNSINRTFLSPGKYTLNLEVRTQKGLKSQASTTIFISDTQTSGQSCGREPQKISCPAGKVAQPLKDSNGCIISWDCQGQDQNPPPSGNVCPVAPPSEFSSYDSDKDGKIETDEMIKVLNDYQSKKISKDKYDQLYLIFTKQCDYSKSNQGSSGDDKVQLTLSCAQDKVVLRSIQAGGYFETVTCWIDVSGIYQYNKWALSGNAEIIGSGIGKDVTIKLKGPGEVTVTALVSSADEPFNYKYKASKTIEVLPPGSKIETSGQNTADFICTPVDSDGKIIFDPPSIYQSYMDISCIVRNKGYFIRWNVSLGDKRVVGATMGESIRVRLYQQDEGKDFSITATSYTGTFNNQKVDSTTKKFSVVSKTLRGSNTAPAVLEALREGVVFNPVPGGNVQIAFKVCDAERDKTFMHIDFGDNTGAFREISGVCASRVWPKIYNSAGTYTVTLTVFDEFGEAVVMKRDIVIGSGGGWKGPAQIGFTKVNIDDYASFKDHRYMEKASPLPGELYPSSSLPITPEPSSYQTFSGPIYSGAQRQTGQAGSRGQTPQESQGEVAGDPGCPIIDFQVLANYDRNNNRIIEPEEMLSVVSDYTAQQISRENAEAMVSAYFKQCKVGVKKSSSGSGGTLNQGGTPALGTANPVEAVNLETGDCRQFNSENEIPAGWERLFPELGESCSSLNF